MGITFAAIPAVNLSKQPLLVYHNNLESSIKKA